MKNNVEQIKVLLVEDDRVDQLAFQRAVRENKFPYEYAIAGSLREAREALGRETFDVILADYHLGDGTALELLTEERETPVIIMTGSASPRGAVEAMKAGACDYLLKDGEREYLQIMPVTVGKVLKIKAAERERQDFYERLEQLVTERTAELAEVNAKLRTAYAAVEQARDAAELASRTKTEFIMNMSHEFRTPLNAVVGFTQVLQGEYYGPLNDKQRRYLEDLAKGALRLQQLTENIFLFAQVDQGSDAPQPSAFLLEEFLGSTLDAWRDEAAARGITLERKGDVPAQTMISSDPEKLRIVLDHLLGNALKFNRAEGAVTLQARLVGVAGFPAAIEISVADTGIGIRAEDLARLFQPFTQLEAPLNKTYAGVGLGLALSKRLVESLGGRLEVESEYGRGSRFYFTLPAG
ncbi:MAG: ATP-binding protein [Smithellaceae bacterium]|nr:ATP-binding protein [Smithellaceae bacterium]